MLIYRVAFIGESGVGKTSLIKSFIGEEVEGIRTTIGMDFYAFNTGGLKIVIWDFAGQKWFRNSVVNFLKGASLIVMVFDLSRIRTFIDLINNWSHYVLELNGAHIPVILVGNKSDIRRISDKDILGGINYLKKKLNIVAYLQTSALRKIGVSDLFQVIFNQVKAISENMSISNRTY